MSSRAGSTCRKDSNEWLLHWRTPSHNNACCCLNLKWRHVKRAFSHESLAPLCTRTTISRLISCESCSLETLNHSFSVLSWATSLTTLTRVPPCLPNTGDGGVEVGGWQEVHRKGASNLACNGSKTTYRNMPRGITINDCSHVCVVAGCHSFHFGKHNLLIESV